MDEKTRSGIIFSIVISAIALLLTGIHFLTVIYIFLTSFALLFHSIIKYQLKHNQLFGKILDDDINKEKIEKSYIKST